MQIKHYEKYFQASDITLEDECKAAGNAIIGEYRTYASGEREIISFS
jgi:hypothetical protein